MAIDGTKANLGDKAEPWVAVVERQLAEAQREIREIRGLVTTLLRRV